MTAVSNIQTASCLLTEESLLVTREMLRLCKESQDAGVVTLAMIHRQGAQLKHVETNLDSMHGTLEKTETDLIEMERNERCCCFEFCSRREGIKSNKQVSNDTPTDTEKPTRRNTAAPAAFTSKTINGNGDEINDNLRGVAQVTGNLKNLALDMGNEITNQNRGLDRMNTKAEANKVKLSSSQTRADNLIKS